ncbi:hypothetical protein F9278_33495 [Streptomyces phaeolivaceus]|uniref:Uncharacterized protein n=1 Tax=Streptomyces phaeolivaceus TaxID=2653200 RepID=A0A5P8KAE2_9ACTN|nr:hypothetical protein F9278_33495 [Streptomyces phaeolivaceus]
MGLLAQFPAPLKGRRPCFAFRGAGNCATSPHPPAPRNEPAPPESAHADGTRVTSGFGSIGTGVALWSGPCSPPMPPASTVTDRSTDWSWATARHRSRGPGGPP